MRKKSRKPIYTITTLKDLSIENLNQSRCVGFYYDLDFTIEAVENNSCDIYEDGHYQYAVVEEFKEGIYNFQNKEIWFEWNKRKKKYKKIEKPKQLNYIICFGMG